MAEEFGHGGRLILVKAVQSDERIEHEQRGSMKIDRSGEFLTIPGAIQAQGVGADDTNIDLIEFESSILRQGDEPQTQSSHGIFCCKEQDWSGAMNGESAEAWKAGSDRDRHFETGPGFERLGRAGNKADGMNRPEALDQPGLVIGYGFEVGGTMTGNVDNPSERVSRC